VARERVEFDVIGRDVGGSKTFDKLADSAEHAGDKVDDLGDELRSLDKDIAASKLALVELAREFDRTGNKDLFKDFRRQKSQLRQLMNLKSVMEDVGGDAAGSFGTSFLTRVGPLVMRGAPSALGPVGAAVGAPLAAGAALVIGTAVAGAIVGAAGVGGVAGGLLVASKHPAVKSAADALGAEVMGTLQRSAVGFVPATIDAIGILRAEFVDMRGDLDRLFGASASFLEPLTRGAAKGIHSIVHGLAEAAVKAGPVISVIADGMALIGDTIGDGIGSLADNAESGARALAILFLVVDAGVRTFFALTDAAAETFGVLEKIGVLGVGAAITAWTQGSEEATQKTEGLSDELRNLLGGFRQTETAVSTATPPVLSMGAAMQQAGISSGYLSDELTRLNGDLLGIEEAQSNVEAAIDNASDAIKANGKTLDESTPKGRANAAALRELATSAKQSAEDVFDATLATGDYTGAQQAANAILAKAKEAYINNRTAITGNRTEAKRLADQIFGTPKQWKTTFQAATEAASAKITGLQRQVNNLHGKTITITTRFTSSGDAHVSGGIGSGTQRKDSEGGLIRGPGTGTSDDIIHRISNGEYVLRAAAVRTLGVDFLDALNQADRTGVVRAPTASPAGGSRRAAPRAGSDDERLVALLRRGLSGLTLVIDDRTGRTAQLFARAGG
jgi:hypothetical protein